MGLADVARHRHVIECRVTQETGFKMRPLTRQAISARRPYGQDSDYRGRLWIHAASLEPSPEDVAQYEAIYTEVRCAMCVSLSRAFWQTTSRER